MKILTLALMLLLMSGVAMAFDENKTYWYDDHSTTNYYAYNFDANLDTKTFAQTSSAIVMEIRDSDGGDSATDASFYPQIEMNDYYNISIDSYSEIEVTGSGSTSTLKYYLSDENTNQLIKTFSITNAGTGSWWYNITAYFNESNLSSSVITENGTNSSISFSSLTPPIKPYYELQVQETSDYQRVRIEVYNTTIWSNEVIDLKLSINEGVENFTIIANDASYYLNDTPVAGVQTLTGDRTLIQWSNSTFEINNDYTPSQEDIVSLEPNSNCELTIKVFGGGNRLTDAYIKFETVTGYTQYYVTNARLTDVTGEAITPLKNNNYYRYTISHPDYNSATYYYLAQCDLERTINVYMDTNTTQYVTALDVNHSYNNVTKIVTVNWSDSDSQNATVNTTVYRETITGDLIICTVGQTGVTNTTTCNVSTHTGTVFISVSHSGLQDYGSYVSVSRRGLGDVINPEEGALYTFLIMLVVAGFGIISPVIAIIAGLLGLIAVLLLGIFTPITITFVIIAAVIGAVISVKVRT